MSNAQSKTDLNFLLAMLEAKNNQNINAITKRLKSIIYSIGSKGDPSVDSLLSALTESFEIQKTISKLNTQSITDENFVLSQTNELKQKLTHIDEVYVNNSPLSRSYAFYTPEEVNNLNDNEKKIEELKNKNLDVLESAFKLNFTQLVQKTIDVLIKINKQLSLMPFAKNGPDQYEILIGVERLIDMNQKTIQQEAFRQQSKLKEDSNLETELTDLENHHQQPGE